MLKILFGNNKHFGDCISPEIAFNAGSHTEIIRMACEDYERLAEPKIQKFSRKTVSLTKDPSERWEEDL